MLHDFTLKASDFKPGMRVGLHPGCVDWMRGDKYGTVQSVSTMGTVRVTLDVSGRTRAYSPDRLSPLE